MKLKIKIKVLEPGCMPEIKEVGDWIDLKSAIDITVPAMQCGTLYKKDGEQYRDVKASVTYIPLGVAIKLPKGFEAILAPRSSSPKKKHIFQSNSIGIIDESYCGNLDQWMMPCSPLEQYTINKGDSICQFRIQLSQKATFWQKLKWLFSSGVELIEVDNLSDNNRGGFGTTGK